MSSIVLEPSSVAKHANIKVSKFNDLDENTQEIAFKAIGSLNSSISTDNDSTTWDKYTDTIIERLQEHPTSQNTFFVAQDKDSVVGYVAFYTRRDEIPYPNRFINQTQAYCSWTAVDDGYRGRGLAIDLKLQIFNPEHCVESFRGHIKKTNTSSLRVVEKFNEMGYRTSKENKPKQVLYTVFNLNNC